MEPTKNRARKLHLDAPLMSTRRPYALTDNASKTNLSSMHLSPHESDRRVPFLWERAPGVPKDVHSDREAKVMSPKPPPGRWRRPSIEDTNSGNNGDVDDCNGDGSDHDVYSDALDDLSLSQSSGIGCRISIDQPSVQCKTSSSFIMDRFLPAANALAAASSLGIPKYSKQAAAPPYSHRLQREIDMIIPRPRSRANSSKAQTHTNPCIEAPPSKTCGIMPLLPWTLKSTVCGYKSPVRSQTPRASLDSGLRIRTKRCVTDGALSSEMDGELSGRARKSVGWGLPFLDTSRLRLRGRSSVDGGKWKDFIVGRKSESGSERSMKRAVAERGRAACNLPQLKGPSEPWLSHAVNSVNRRW